MNPLRSHVFSSQPLKVKGQGLGLASISLITIRSLMAIMNLIATLWIIYNQSTQPWLYEYQLSRLPHRACYYIQTGHGERGKVGSSKSVAAAAHSASVWCVVLAATN